MLDATGRGRRRLLPFRSGRLGHPSPGGLPRRGRLRLAGARHRRCDARPGRGLGIARAAVEESPTAAVPARVQRSRIGSPDHRHAAPGRLGRTSVGGRRRGQAGAPPTTIKSIQGYRRPRRLVSLGCPSVDRARVTAPRVTAPRVTVPQVTAARVGTRFRAAWVDTA
jgi:hypothetical protein